MTHYVLICTLPALRESLINHRYSTSQHKTEKLVVSWWPSSGHRLGFHLSGVHKWILMLLCILDGPNSKNQIFQIHFLFRLGFGVDYKRNSTVNMFYFLLFKLVEKLFQTWIAISFPNNHPSSFSLYRKQILVFTACSAIPRWPGNKLLVLKTTCLRFFDKRPLVLQIVPVRSKKQNCG